MAGSLRHSIVSAYCNTRSLEAWGSTGAKEHGFQLAGRHVMLSDPRTYL